MTNFQILELVAAVLLLGAGIWLYRKPSPEPDHYGSQGAVLLFALAAILAVHAIVTARAFPSDAEVEVVEE